MTGKLKRLSALVALLLCISCNRAAVPTGPPIIHFSTLELDLGEIDFAPDGRAVEFPFENRGLLPLRIERVVSSCGCAAAKVERTVLAPEESSRIFAVIAPRQSEERSASITVYSNDPARPKTTLRFKWKAVAPLDLNPPSTDFGTVRPGINVSRSVNLVWRTAQKRCVVKELECYPTSEVIAAFEDVHPENSDSRSQTLRLTLSPTSEPGLHIGRVVLHLDGCWQDEITLPISWRVQDVIVVSPERVFLGVGGPGASLEKRCELTSSAGRVLIDSVELARPDPTIVLQVDSKDASATGLSIRWTLPMSPGLHSATVRVHCSEPEPREFKVPVSAFVKATSETN